MSAEATGRRIEETLERLTSGGNPEAAAAAEELVRALMDLYGTGLSRITALLGRGGLAPLLDDEAVAALLVLHDLHPEDAQVRIRRALRAVGAEDTTVEAFDAHTGSLRLRSAGGGGCRSTTGAARQRVEAALSAHVPEVTTVVFEEPEAAPREPALLQIGSRAPGTP